MKTIFVGVALFCLASGNLPAGDWQEYQKPIRLDASTLLVLRTREGPAPDGSATAFRELRGTAYFEFVAVRNGVESTLEETSLRGSPFDDSPITTGDTLLHGDKLCFIYHLMAGPCVAIHAVADEKGVFHTVKKTTLGAGRIGKFLVTKAGTVEMETGEYAGPGKAMANTEDFELNASGDFVKK